MVYLLDLLGVAFFAITGALAAGKKDMDLFGVIVLALVTALGGGTLRDLVLGIHPIFWISNTTYILVAFGSSLLIFAFARYWMPPFNLLLVLDAFGLAVFTAIGVQKALILGVHAIIAVIMGVMTGVVGGIMRDLLSGVVPLILRRQIYATASLCGAIAFVCLSFLTRFNESLIFSIAIIITLIIRLTAIKYSLSLPIFSIKSNNDI